MFYLYQIIGLIYLNFLKDIDYCAGHKCQNEATCLPIATSQSYICHCLSGFAGNFCQVKLEIANNNNTTTSTTRRSKLNVKPI